MKKLAPLTTTVILIAFFGLSGYNVGNKAPDIKLKNAYVKKVPVVHHSNVKNLIVVFTRNNCPVAKTNKDRVMALNAKYASRGYSVIAINPNNPAQIDEARYANMRRLMQLLTGSCI